MKIIKQTQNRIHKEETSELSNVEVNSDLDRSCFSGMMGDTV